MPPKTEKIDPFKLGSRDEFDDYNIARAVSFVAFLRLSPKETYRKEIVVKNDKTRERTKQRVFKEALKMNEKYSTPGGRKTCVYAVTPEGWTSFVSWKEYAKPK